MLKEVYHPFFLLPYKSAKNAFRAQSIHMLRVFLVLRRRIHDEKLPRYHYKHIKNTLGYVMIFPNHIFHMVRKNPCDKIRYTVGITISHYNSELGKIFASSDCSNLLVISSPHTDTNKNISYQ